MILIDTNVIVYAYDTLAGDRQRTAQKAMGQLRPAGRASLSSQVLGEFFRAITNHLSPRFSAAEALTEVTSLANGFIVWPVDELVAMEAARGVRDHQFGYWDSQLWATARLNQVRTILSEDFRDGSVVEGVAFVNPFVEGFDLEGLMHG